MTDRTGGQGTLNYMHRTRPEGYEEEEEEDSESEEVIALKARTGDPNHPMNAEDDRFRRKDLPLARTLRLRAEGLEKVITSMLDQPPPIHPLTDDPSTNNHPNLKELHRLPNGVRLRLALGAIVNDLFARQPFHPPYRHTHPPQSQKPTHATQDYSPSDLPEVLRSLAPISGAFALHAQQPTHQPSPMALHSPAYSDYTTQYSQPSPGQPGSTQIPYQTFLPQPSLSDRTNPLPRPTPRTRSLYFTGSDPSTANCPPALRCPRHLQSGCEICTDNKSLPRAIPRARSGHRGSVSSSWKAAASAGVSPGLSGWQEGTGIGSGLLRPAVRGSALRRTVVIENDRTAGAGNTKLSKLIPRFLRLSALVAAELGREARGEEVESSSESGRANGSGGDNEGGMATGAPPGSGNSPTPGNVSPGRSPWNGGNNSGGGGAGYASVPSSPTMRKAGQSPADSQARERARMYEKALKPSREWYMLLAGLLTRAVLEGYLTAGWSSLQAVQCLLLVGLGINESLGIQDSDDEDEDDQFASFDPDELPDLMQAVKILFPSSRTGSFGVKDQAEEEYEMEMLERLRRVRVFSSLIWLIQRGKQFYDIPLSTPDCSIHMEGLDWQYPAENVERAAVRYCEAIARWRGKPELETVRSTTHFCLLSKKSHLTML